MFPKDITFKVDKRRLGGVGSLSYYDWALHVRFDNSTPWTVKQWDKCPSHQQVADAEELVLRSIEVYYNHIKKPDHRLTHYFTKYNEVEK